jgi:carbamoyltransferase
MTRPFTVLGINHGGHDTSAALMQEGELVAACEQERYTLDKHSRRFPVEAIQDCLDRVGIGIEGVDELAFAFQPLYHIREVYLRPALTDKNRIGTLISDIHRIDENYSIEALIRQKTNFLGKLNYYHHHMCHLASAWYPSGFDEALVVSYDGIGEVESGLLAVGRKGSFEVFHRDTRYPDSLGLLYSAVTHYLGWRHHCDEGIIMGLACYGDPEQKVPGDGRSYIQIFREIVRETGDYDYEIDRDWIAYHEIRDRWVSDHFCKVFGKKRNPNDQLTIHHKHIASALQARLEEVVLGQLQKAQLQHSVERLCLSGGVALNCSMNGKIEQSGIFDEIFVQPASGDAGVAAGACYLAYKAHQPAYKPEKMHNFYLGSVFTDKDIQDAFAERGIVATCPNDLFERTAARLVEGNIVGWFQGGAEFGPRALGNRSILTRSFPADMKDYLNSRVKFREEFRPFAPAVLSEYAGEYFQIKQESPHMLIACQATDKAKKEIPATVHVDGSCRVQTVRPKNNTRFHQLLSAFFATTGCPVLLNTSFNVKGQPIVNTPGQAIDCYLSTQIDCLVIGSFFIEKDP